MMMLSKGVRPTWTYQIPPDDQLWLQVLEYLDYRNDGHTDLSACELRTRAPGTYWLYTPHYAVQTVEERSDAIEEVLVQFVFVHRVDVYVQPTNDPVEVRIVSSTGLLDSDIL